MASSAWLLAIWGRLGWIGGLRRAVKKLLLQQLLAAGVATPGLQLLHAAIPALPCTPPQGNEVWIVKLEGIDTPEDARLLRGHSLLIPPSARGELEDEDEFYVQVRSWDWFGAVVGMVLVR